MFLRSTFFILVFAVLFQSLLIAQSDKPFYKNGTYDESIPTPEKVLGLSIGDRPIRYTEVVTYLKILAEKSTHVKLIQEGETYQGRKLFYLVVTSEKNFSNIDKIKTDISKLSDPRILDSPNDAETIINSSPAVAMMMYSIHGNETSGTDAAIALAYQLAAGTDTHTKELLNDLIICIYPMENPDGRERFLSQRETWTGKIPNSDVQSFPFSGLWPSGRTNHYHFDLNRDWFILSQPESRARVKAVTEWNPQLVVDAHEMGSYSTYLFNPPREPINPFMHDKIIAWWDIFAKDQANAFDQYGWSYYTREWLEEWYPGYGSSWASYTGAVAILYEQARTAGNLVKRPDGTILTFRESVHHQFISSLANLTTAANNKKELLREYYEIKKEAVAGKNRREIKSYLIDPKENLSRVNKLIERLLLQNIEVYKAEEEFRLSSKSYYDNESETHSFKKGTYIIPLNQPNGLLVNAIMDFDTRMKNSFIQSERESLEKGEGTRLYEVSSWSLPLAFGVDAYETQKKVSIEQSQVKLPLTIIPIINDNVIPAYGYLIKYEDDSSVNFLSKLLSKGYKVRAARKTFTVEGNSFERGTLLIRKIENSENNLTELIEFANKFNVQLYPVNTALSSTGIDLGGGYFKLLTEPKTAILTGKNISMNNYGALWYLFDQELGLRITTLDYASLAGYDLRKYNVLIFPSVWGGITSIKETMGKSGLTKLKTWIKNGGTLITMGSSSAFAADSSVALSKVKLRRQSISELDDYKKAYEKEVSVKHVEVDSLELWEGKVTGENGSKEIKKGKTDTKELAKLDKESLKFMPRGAILRLSLNEEKWLNFGAGEKLPALFHSSYVYLSKSPVQTAVRFSDAADLRLAGLVWPEAKLRIEHTAYLTRESSGNGQIIMFAVQPNFRSYFYGTTRLLLNAVLLGPGFGTKQTVEW